MTPSSLTRTEIRLIFSNFSIGFLSRAKKLSEAVAHLPDLAPCWKDRLWGCSCEHALLGETGQAMQLARAYEQHCNRLLTPKFDPQSDKLHSDPSSSASLKRRSL
jgi:hypothetical protein